MNAPRPMAHAHGPSIIGDGNSRIIVNLLRTGGISFQVQSGNGTMGCVLDRRQTIALRTALLHCLHPR